VQSPADGYSILFASANLGKSPHIYPSLAYNAVTDMAPVTLCGLFLARSAMKRTIKQHAETLGRIIDATSIEAVLREMSLICAARALKFPANEKLVKQWHDAEQILIGAANAIDFRREMTKKRRQRLARA
jgi:hypothetical protein